MPMRKCGDHKAVAFLHAAMRQLLEVVACAMASWALANMLSGEQTLAQADGATGGRPAMHAIPTPDEIAAQTLLIRDAFAEELQKNQEFPLRTARKLLAAASDTADPARAWALLDEASRLATVARALPESISAATERARLFGLEPGREIVTTLDVMAGRQGADAAGVCRIALGLAKDATEAEHFALADDAVDVASRVVATLVRNEKKAGLDQRRGTGQRNRPPIVDPDSLRDELQSVRAVLADRKKRRAAYDTACETLSRVPDDPEANLQAGMYLCVTAGAWQDGLEKLVRCGTSELVSAATAEVALAAENFSDVQAAFAVGEKWWRIANSMADTDNSRAFRNHVIELYERVEGRATDPLDRALINQRRAQSRR